MRAPGRGRIVRRRNRRKLCHTVLACENRLREPVPAGSTRCRQVIEAARCPEPIKVEASVYDTPRDCGGGGFGDESCRRGCSNLIVDNLEFFSLLGQFEHGQQEIFPPWPVDPTGSQYQMRSPRSHHPLFAGELGPAVGIDRRHRIAFQIGLGLGAVEHIVRRVVDQRRTGQSRLLGQDARGVAIDPQGTIELRFRLVHRGVSRRIDNQMWA